MAQVALVPTRVKSIGNTVELVLGVAGGSGTTTVVTIAQLASIDFVLVSGATSTTAVYCDTISGNTFTATHANNDLFTYIAHGKGLN